MVGCVRTGHCEFAPPSGECTNARRLSSSSPVENVKVSRAARLTSKRSHRCRRTPLKCFFCRDYATYVRCAVIYFLFFIADQEIRIRISGQQIKYKIFGFWTRQNDRPIVVDDVIRSKITRLRKLYAKKNYSGLVRVPVLFFFSIWHFAKVRRHWPFKRKSKRR